jgi:NagD protein
MPELKLFAFDLDGTLYSGEAAVSGAIKLVEGLRKGYKIAFFTNNSWKTAAEVLEKLSRLGFECRREEVYAASSASVRYLKEAGLDNLFVIGSPALRAEVREAGLRLLDDGFADNLVVALDYGFGYDKIAAALSILTRGGKFVACNEDPSFPAGAGKTLPGCGAMVAAVAAASRRRPDFIVGTTGSNTGRSSWWETPTRATFAWLWTTAARPCWSGGGTGRLAKAFWPLEN